MAFLWKHPASKYWVARFIDSTGKRRNRSTKVVATEKNRRQAQALADEFEIAATKKKTALQVRRTIAALHKEITGGELSILTVREHAEAWLARKKTETAPATIVFYADSVRKLLAALGPRADVELSEIVKADLVAFRDGLNLAPKTINHHVKVIRMVFLDAKREELIADNPAEFLATVKNPKAGKKARRPFTVEELQAILGEADDEWRSMVLCGLYTGQRLGDIARLRWRDFDFRQWTLRITTRKTDRDIAIPIAGPLKRHLEGLTVPTNRDAHLHPRAAANVEARGGASGHLSNQFTRLLAKAGIREKRVHRKKGEGQGREESMVGFHSLRGTATSMLHEAGVPQAVVQQIVGHDSPEVHAVYVSMGDAILRDSIGKLPDIG